jgi:hypothetical protein
MDARRGELQFFAYTGVGMIILSLHASLSHNDAENGLSLPGIHLKLKLL